jgi:signal transduction histidine kinase
VDARPLAIREVVADAAAHLARLGGTTRVRLTCEPGGDTVVSDAAILRRVVEHVIENALKFSPPDSEVDVWVRRLGEGVEVRVRDQGPGISDSYLDGAFDAFAQQEPTNTRERGGLGLGLFASRKLVALLEGRLDLTRHPEGGTEAVLYLPDLRLDQPLARVV